MENWPVKPNLNACFVCDVYYRCTSNFGNWHVRWISTDVIVFLLNACNSHVTVVVLRIEMTDVEAQEYFDNFFEEVFTELEDRVIYSTVSVRILIFASDSFLTQQIPGCDVH